MTDLPNANLLDPLTHLSHDAPPSARRGVPYRNPIWQQLPTVLGLLLASGICVAIMSLIDMQAGAIAFALFVLILAAARPKLVFPLALLLSPFANDVELGVPVKVAASDLCLFLALPFIFGRRSQHFTRIVRAPYWLAVFAYLSVCVGSTVLSGLDKFAVTSTSQMVVYMVFTVAMFAAGMGKPEEILPRLYIVGMIGCVIAFTMIASGSNYVLGLHKNSVGQTLAGAVIITLGLLLSLGDKHRGKRPTLVLLVLLMLGLLFSLSRGAWMAAALGSVIMLTLYGRLSLAIKLAAYSVPVLAIMWLALPEEKKEYATDLSASAHNVQARLLMIDYALSRFRESPLLGVGVGLRKTYDATNVALATLAETGIVGLTFFASIYASIAFMTLSAARRLKRTDPAFALLAIGAGLVFGKLLHGMVDHYWSRGCILYWAGAGFVVLGYVASRSRTDAAAEPLGVSR